MTGDISAVKLMERIPVSKRMDYYTTIHEMSTFISEDLSAKLTDKWRPSKSILISLVKKYNTFAENYDGKSIVLSDDFSEIKKQVFNFLC